jgi:hypothetical protein
MKRHVRPLLILPFIAVATFLQADTLIIPIGQQPGVTVDLPQRGLSESAVLQRLGEPTRRHPAVGQPPITRWEYADFSVYFEQDRVIHSVRQHRPAAGN